MESTREPAAPAAPDRERPAASGDGAPLHIAILLHKLSGGGVQRSLVHLARGFRDAGHRVDLLVCRDTGPATHSLPDGLTPRFLPRTPSWRARRAVARACPGDRAALLAPVLAPAVPPWPIKHLDSLAAYLAEQRPDVIFAAGPYFNLTALWARDLAGVATRVVGSERVSFPHFRRPVKRMQARWRHLPALVRRFYPRLDRVVGVSRGVTDHLVRETGLSPEHVTTIHNPVVSARIAEWTAEAVDHPWFAPGRDAPVILGVGRLDVHKDFDTLIRAFAAVRRDRAARLVILGDGPKRRDLDRLARRLGVREAVDLPGWAGNPYAYYARADLFVLSSQAEGLPNALLEAMASGCPVVSTDCPSGPDEILMGGDIAPLVRVGDAAGMAEAMVRVLADPPAADTMRERAAAFSADRSVARHLELFRAVTRGRTAPV